MKKLSRKLFLSILSVAFALVALGTTTFAWFTLGNEVTVSQINAEIIADEGIEISLGNTNKWYTTLSQQNVADYISANAINTELDNIAMTTLDTDSTAAFAFKDGDNSASTKYLQLQFNVRYTGDITDNYHVDLFLKNAQFDSAAINWTADTTITNAKTAYNLTAGAAKVFYPSDAARLTLSTGTTSGYLFTCQAYGHTVSDVYTAINYGSGNDQVSATDGNKTTGFAQLYAASKNYTIVTDNADADFGMVNPASTYAASDTKIGEFTTNSKTVTFYTTIWLDGWDDECINAIINGALTLKLEFGVTAEVVNN